ncbi:MAG: S28 family serine protease [Bdellovibrionia bacterium]
MKKQGLAGVVFLVGLVGLFISTQAFAGGFVDLIVRQNLEKQLQAETQPSFPTSLFNWAKDDDERSDSFLSPQSINTTTAGVFEQRIDPSNPQDKRTFHQRYFLNSAYASGPDAPVFFYICGESVCSPAHGAAVDYAKLYHGHVVALEHRYYGTSQPMPTLSSANLKYLKTEYALYDLANFEAYAQNTLNLKGKWIAMGGSYPGSLSAYYRLKYPQMVVGSLASSGPVQARENFELYDWVVNDRAGPQCARAIRNVVAVLENALKNDANAFAAAKHQFQCDGVADPVDFLYIVADMAAAAVQYGMKDQFCATLINGGADPVGAYARAGVQAFSALGMAPEEDSFQMAKIEDPMHYASGVGMRQWLYQSCTEYGYFQNAYHDPVQATRSSMINPAFHRRICQELFGTPPLNTAKIMVNFYQPLLNPAKASRILFTNGSIDPWATLSITHENGNDKNPNTAAMTISGAAHCDDLRGLGPSSTPIGKAQELFSNLVSQWLK